MYIKEQNVAYVRSEAPKAWQHIKQYTVQSSLHGLCNGIGTQLASIWLVDETGSANNNACILLR